MADNEEVLNRANSLMRPEGERAYGSSPLGGRPEGERITAPSPLGGRRRRAFVAGPAIPKLEELVFPEAPPLEEDDLPVLTEVVSPEAAVSDAGPDRFDETLVAILVSDIAHSIEQQMSIELPMLIEASLLNAREELRAGIRTTMDLALRDFLARRRQLRLPLDEPNRDA